MMRKQKKNNFLKLAGLVILVLALALSFVACGEPETPSDDDDSATGVTEVTLPVKNGNFEYTTGTNYPKTPKNWTYSTGYILTSSDEPHAYNGVIAVDDDSFSAYSDSYHLSANPSQKGTDGYVLMLNNVLPYHTAYTSETVTITKGKYYELVVYVKTALAEGATGGAYIYLENDGSTRVFKSFNKVSASDWTAYSFWIEASKSSNMSVNLKLALGSGDAKYHADLTSGSAFFDSIAITEKTKAEYDEVVDGATALKYSFALRNAEFTETSSDVVSTKPVTPYDWTSYVGRDDNGSSIAPTSGLYRGVINTTYAPTTGALKDDNIEITSANNSADNNMLMIYLSNKDRPSAYSYYSNAITFEFDKAYELTFKVRTAGLKNKAGDNIDGTTSDQGVAVKLGEDITLFNKINTNKTWETYTAYILGSPTQPKNYSLYFWLGQGHEGDKDNYVSGAAFFDSITLKEITIDAYNSKTESTKVKKYAMTTENLLTVAPFSGTNAVPTYWTGDFVENHGDALTRKTILRTVDLSAYATDSQLENKQLTASDPGIPVNNRTNKNQAIALFNQTANAYEANFTTNFTIKPNLSYRLSFWVKTDSINEGKGATFTLVKNDEDKTTLATLSNINTETFEDGKVKSNEWTEIVFAIQGNQTDSNEVTLKVALGSGDMYNPDYLSGTVFMSNMYLESLTAKEYSNVTSSSYIAKHSFRQTASTQITNGNFNNIDVDKSELNANGKLNGKPGAVQSWTSAFADDAQNKLADNVVAGIIDKDLYDNTLTEVQSLGTTPFFNASDASVFNGGPNLLMIYNKVATEYGYTSASSSLTASSYYKVTVNVKTAGNAKAKIIVKNDGKDTVIDNVDTQGAWKTYTVFIKVGLNSSNVKVYLGLKSEGAGVAFFDNANYTSIDKDAYNKATANNTDVLKINLNFDSFSTSETEFPAKPANYDGKVLGTAPSANTDYASGILDKNHVNAEIEEVFALTASDVIPVDGAELLAIYNKNDTAYAYTSSSYTFNANTFYKVTANVKTKDLQEGDKAKITLTLSSTETAVFYSNDTAWKTYTFYVKMDDSALSGVTISLGLGEFNKGDDGKAITADYAKGYAFFDEIGIEEIDEATYTAGVNAITAETTDVKKIDVVVANQNADSDEDDTDSDESLTAGNSLSAWEIVAIVSASLLSVALIAVMIVVFVKRALPKMKEKKNKKYKKPSYDKRASKVATKDDLDKFKD